MSNQSTHEGEIGSTFIYIYVNVKNDDNAFNVNTEDKPSKIKKRMSMPIEEFKPHFPPRITLQDIYTEILSNNNRHGRRATKLPTAFDAYKLCFRRELELQSYNALEQMITSLAINSWAKEPADVKEEYKRLLTEAKTLQ
ncbi:9290_t:CDS:2 [Dentiscutata erythropus]|uniref:9290_t:CDS:1 n=1 Tax=Dentiscutata erythropus TaxID=1348616 RepID=A0A9N9FFM0_9GLOM|nr:9290_t:CDS:2 [Dentiscutata erythropus]